MFDVTHWSPLMQLGDEELRAARLSLHWATQLVAAAGSALGETASDFSHTTLVIDDDKPFRWRGGPLSGRSPVGLDFDRLALHVADPDERYELIGRTLDEGLSWLGSRLGVSLRLLEHDLPSHEVGKGAPFPSGDPRARRTLDAYFRNAHRALAALSAHDSRWSPPRMWPHHFDLAALLTFDGAEGQRRSVGVGLSPGDDAYATPYLYVSPWPYPPESTELPPLQKGHWHRDGFTAAILTTPDLAGPHGAEITTKYMREALPAAASLAGRPDSIRIG
ncbi:MAG: hypothetical protein AAGA56_18590 [Myxococcota bacterium]